MLTYNALKLQTRIMPSFSLGDVTGLVAWYKLKTGVTVDGNGDISLWSDSSGNTSVDMDLAPPAADNDVAFNAATGAASFRTADKSSISTAGDQLNLGAFTIFGVIDVVESGAANEAVIGRLGNDEIRFFRGSSSTGFRAKIDGFNKNIDLDSSLPTGKFLFTLSRASGGSIALRINGTTQSNTTSLAITNLFDFTRMGNGSTDSDIYEIAIYDNEISTANRTLVEADINARNGL